MGGTFSLHIHLLIILQKKCLIIINKTSYLEHTQPLFASNRVLKILDIHKYCQACYIHKNLEIITSATSSHSHSTRQNFINPIFQRLGLSQRSIHYSGVVYWNSLPSHIKNIVEMLPFKRYLKLYILDSYQNIE